MRKSHFKNVLQHLDCLRLGKAASVFEKNMINYLINNIEILVMITLSLQWIKKMYEIYVLVNHNFEVIFVLKIAF